MSGPFVGVLQTHPECWTSAHSLLGSSTGMQQGMQCSAAYQVCNTLTSARPPCRGMQVCNGMQQVCSMQVCNGMQYATVCIPPQKWGPPQDPSGPPPRTGPPPQRRARVWGIARWRSASKHLVEDGVEGGGEIRAKVACHNIKRYNGDGSACGAVAGHTIRLRGEACPAADRVHAA